jgi:hypothetical protein
MPNLVRRLVERNRMLTVRISQRELEHFHRAARAGGLSLSDLLREGARVLSRELLHDNRARLDDGAQS